MRCYLLRGPSFLAVSMVAIAIPILFVCPADSQDEARAGPDQRKPPASGVDLYGDPLPEGALGRLGTIRYRHAGLHKSAQFIPNSETFVVGGRSGRVRFYEARSGKLMQEITFPGASLQAFQVTADGKTLATLLAPFRQKPRRWHMQLVLCHTATGEKKSTIDWDEPVTLSRLLALAPDGLVIATSSVDGMLRIWDVTSGEELLKFSIAERSEVEAITFSPRGDTLAVATRRGVFLWRWQRGEKPQKLAGPRGGAACVAFSPDGKWLAAAGGGWPFSLRLFDAATGGLVRQWKLPEAQTMVDVLAFDPGSRLIAVATDRGVQFWEVATGRVVKSVEDDREMADLAIASDGTYRTGIEVNRCVGHRSSPTRIRFTPDGETVVTGESAGRILIWAADSGRPLRELAHPRWLAAWEISPDGKYIVSVAGGPDNSVRLWETETGKQIYKLYGYGEERGGDQVAFAPDGKTFATFGSDMFLRTWDVRTGKALTEHAIRPSGMKIRVDEEGISSTSLIRSARTRLLRPAPRASFLPMPVCCWCRTRVSCTFSTSGRERSCGTSSRPVPLFTALPCRQTQSCW